MGWWSGRSEGENKEILRAITALELRVNGLEIENRSLKLEWENAYDKLMKAAARLNARTRRETAEDAPTPPNGDPVTPSTGLGSHDVLAAARARRGRP